MEKNQDCREKSETTAPEDTKAKCSNLELELANEFVQYTNCNIFLTGKAGTGKTTFLHTLKKKTSKRLIVTAPTGVAAINAGGVTLHSFFQMPFGPFVQGSEAFERSHKRKFSREKIDIIKNLDLLVIDEISMVRPDLLDCIDGILQAYRQNNLPFGGVQLLMIGDLHQLSPVVKEDEWEILREHYTSFYFFGSNALKRTELVPIELKHIFRQSDSHFIELLNRVRENKLDPLSLKQLNSRYIEGFHPSDDEGYITLSTHNNRTEAINRSKLEASSKKARCFSAKIEGTFPEYTYPTSADLELKVGAQVMFVRNDSSHKKLYFNGKIGKVTKFTQDKIYVKCPSDKREISVEKATWENIQYKIDGKTRKIMENKIGAFAQYPLKLAWAITIHKSQGLTFDKAIIDTTAAFAHGQVYVALSRCKTFEGMLLSSPIPTQAVKTDNAVVQFVKKVSNYPLSRETLETAKIGYFYRRLTECFDFDHLFECMNHLLKLVLENPLPVKTLGGLSISELEAKARSEIFAVSEKFRRQLRRLFSETPNPEADVAILDRVTKASLYFRSKIEAILANPLRQIPVEADNSGFKKSLTQATNQLQKEVQVKLAAVRCCETGFSPDEYSRTIAAAEMDFDTQKKGTTPDLQPSVLNIAHPSLFQTLREWRTIKSLAEKIPRYRILHQKALLGIAIELPVTLSSLKKIKGIGKKSVQKYGDELVTIVTIYCLKNNIHEAIPEKPESSPEKIEQKPGKAANSDTKKASLDLFKTGLTIPQIAKERGLAQSTIEGHVVFLVGEGELEINLLLSTEKHRAIEKKLAEMHETPLGEIKQALGNDYSYTDIKIVKAFKKLQLSKALSGSSFEKQ